MDLSSRQILALAAPLVISYLTWSTLQGQMKTLAQVTPNPVASIGSRHGAELDGPKAPLRDPFSPLTAQSMLHATGDEEAAKGETLVLNATVIVPHWRMAIINGERVYEGQRFRGLRVRKVEPQRVLLAGVEGDAVELPLQVAIVVDEDAHKDDSDEAQSADDVAAFYDEAFPGHGAEMARSPVPGLPPALAGMVSGAAARAAAGATHGASSAAIPPVRSAAAPSGLAGTSRAAALVAAQQKHLAEMAKGLEP
jgi:hypothetical protein